MRRFTRPFCAVISLLASFAPANAASLIGDGLDFTLSHRDLSLYLGSASSDASSRPVVNGLDDASVQALDPLNPVTGRFGHFMRSGLEGAGAPDASFGMVTTITVGAASNAVKLTNSDLLFNPSFSVLTMADPTADLTRLVGSVSQAGDEGANAAGTHPEQDKSSAGVESSIPLPPALPLLAAAIIALAAFGYGLNRWVAPRGAK